MKGNDKIRIFEFNEEKEENFNIKFYSFDISRNLEIALPNAKP